MASKSVSDVITLIDARIQTMLDEPTRCAPDAHTLESLFFQLDTLKDEIVCDDLERRVGSRYGQFLMQTGCGAALYSNRHALTGSSEGFNSLVTFLREYLSKRSEIVPDLIRDTLVFDEATGQVRTIPAEL